MPRCYTSALLGGSGLGKACQVSNSAPLVSMPLMHLVAGHVEIDGSRYVRLAGHQARGAIIDVAVPFGHECPAAIDNPHLSLDGLSAFRIARSRAATKRPPDSFFLLMSRTALLFRTLPAKPLRPKAPWPPRRGWTPREWLSSPCRRGRRARRRAWEQPSSRGSRRSWLRWSASKR